MAIAAGVGHIVRIQLPPLMIDNLVVSIAATGKPIADTMPNTIISSPRNRGLAEIASAMPGVASNAQTTKRANMFVFMLPDDNYRGKLEAVVLLFEWNTLSRGTEIKSPYQRARRWLNTN